MACYSTLHTPTEGGNPITHTSFENVLQLPIQEGIDMFPQHITENKKE